VGGEAKRKRTPAVSQKGEAMLLEKAPLTLEELDGQFAAELPEREMMGLVTIVITNVLNDLSVNVEVRNNNVAIQVCAIVDVLNGILDLDRLTCVIEQR
jgi:hypothetical protein